MRCIFCKSNSAESNSVEHIIPESLGNTKHILPVGFVCDACNNYFSRKVEGPLLNSLYFRTLRSEQFVLSKRGRATQVPALLTPGPHPIQLAISPDTEDGAMSIIVPNEQDFDLVKRHTKSNGEGALYIPVCQDQPPLGIMGRFLAKVAVEALAYRLMHNTKNLNEMIDDEQINLIRDYARFGKGAKSWPYSQRVIYTRNKCHVFEDGKEYQLIHEFDFLLTNERECYFVLAIFGVEYSINVAGPLIKGYEKWLTENNQSSPLYSSCRE